MSTTVMLWISMQMLALVRVSCHSYHTGSTFSSVLMQSTETTVDARRSACDSTPKDTEAYNPWQ